MKPLILIPARYASTRFPAKPLAMIKGVNGTEKPLIQRTWEAAKNAKACDVVIATDDQRIEDTCRAFGADVVLTSSDCRNGTERCAEAAAHFPDAQMIVNFQGDAPLTPSWFVDDLIREISASDRYDMVTPVLRCTPAAAQALRDDRLAGRVGGTTAIFNADGDALYFSKEVLPFSSDGHADIYHHVGIYAFRRDALLRYPDLPLTRFEQAEGLEQLRFLENGRKVKAVKVEARDRNFWEVNNPEDISIVEHALAALGVE